MQLGGYREAFEDFEKALRLDSQHAPTFNNRGLAYARLGRLSRAIDDFGQAIRLDP